MNISPVIPDLYALDLGGKPNIDALVQAGRPWAGLGLKATEGTYYPKDPTWFKTFWPLARTAAGARYGVDWFRYAYHYFRVDEDPVAQADFALGLIDSAGGWDEGDLPLMVDVESAENPADAPASYVVNQVTEFADRITLKQGRMPILYAGSYFRDRAIKDKCGCQLLWIPAYGRTLPAKLYLDMGWTLDEIIMWQYQSTEQYTGPSGYPRLCPLGHGPLDLNAVLIGDETSYSDQIIRLRAIVGA